VVVQFGTKEVETAKPSFELSAASEAHDAGAIEVEDADAPGAPAAEKKEEKSEKDKKGDKLVLSGFVKGEDSVDGTPAILDVPVEKGRVILFSFNPLHRYLNHSDFRFVYNVLLNWNDLPR
ncbi:MAG: hypothetical protein ABUL63_02110, partial [Acidobacteriota bacterium]